MSVMQVLTKGKAGGNWVTKVRVIGVLNGQETIIGDFKANSNTSDIVHIPVNFVAQQVKLIPLEFHQCIDFKCDVEVLPARFPGQMYPQQPV